MKLQTYAHTELSQKYPPTYFFPKSFYHKFTVLGSLVVMDLRAKDCCSWQYRNVPVSPSRLPPPPPPPPALI
jgi:hypothetical protein